MVEFWDAGVKKPRYRKGLENTGQIEQSVKQNDGKKVTENIQQ